MNARKRKTARRNRIKRHFPIGCRVVVKDRSPYGYSAKGLWVVYAHDGNWLKMRREGMSAGYGFHHRYLERVAF